MNSIKDIKSKFYCLFDKLNVFFLKSKMDKLIMVILAFTMLCWTKITNDSWAYIHGANSLLDGLYYFENTTINMRPIFPPMYPLYLAVFIKFLGNNLMTIQISNLVLFLTSCLLYFKIDKKPISRVSFLLFFSLLFGNILSETLFFVLILIIYYIHQAIESKFIKYPLLVLFYTMLIFTRSVGIIVVPFLLLIFSNAKLSTFGFVEFKNFARKNIENSLIFITVIFFYKSVDFLFFGTYRDTHVFRIGIGMYSGFEYFFQSLNFLGSCLNPFRFFFQVHYINILIIILVLIFVSLKNIRITFLLMCMLILYIFVFISIYNADKLDYRFLFWLFLMIFLVRTFPYRNIILSLLMISSLGFFVQYNKQSLLGCFHYKADKRDISANLHTKFFDTKKSTSLLNQSIYGPFVVFDTVSGRRLIGAVRLHEVYYNVPGLED